MARPGTADLLRAVSDAADPDAGEGRSRQRAGRRRRRRAAALGAGDVAAVPRLCGPCSPDVAVDGPAFTSIFQGATRWQTYVALAVSGNLFGDTGLALASVAMVAIIPLVNVFSVSVLAHYASPEKQSVRAIAMTVVRNPLIWACAIGLAINVAHLPLPRIWHEVADALGRSSLAIGLLVTGAGLQLEGMFRPSLAASVAVFLKLILMPVLAIGLGAMVRAVRLQSRHRGGLLGGAGLLQRLCAGAPDGRRRAAAGADHHAADDFGGDHHADRDRAGGVAVIPRARRRSNPVGSRHGSMDRVRSLAMTIRAYSCPASHLLCSVAAKLLRPCRTTVSQVELLR